MTNLAHSSTTPVTPLSAQELQSASLKSTTTCYISPRHELIGESPEKVAAALNLTSNRERQIPFTLETTEPTHRVRYEWLRDLLEPLPSAERRVMDYGCGAGYGAKILSSVSSSVIGVDIHLPTVEYAAAAFGEGRKVQFTTPALLGAECKFDVISCIEMIEHLSLEDGRALLSQFKSQLNPKGLLFLSTPRRPYGNPYHLQEYTFDEMRNEIERAGFRLLGALGQVGTRIEAHADLIGEYKDAKKFTMLFACGHA